MPPLASCNMVPKSPYLLAARSMFAATRSSLTSLLHANSSGQREGSHVFEVFFNGALLAFKAGDFQVSFELVRDRSFLKEGAHQCMICLCRDWWKMSVKRGALGFYVGGNVAGNIGGVLVWKERIY